MRLKKLKPEIDEKFLKNQAKLLGQQKKVLEKELSQIAKKKKTGEKYEPKFLDFGQREDESAQEVTTYEEYLVLERNLSKKLSEVNKSLKRLQKKKYGICESCKKLIEENRLKAFPAATMCLNCANKPRKGFRWTFWKR